MIAKVVSVCSLQSPYIGDEGVLYRSASALSVCSFCPSRDDW